MENEGISGLFKPQDNQNIGGLMDEFSSRYAPAPRDHNGLPVRILGEENRSPFADMPMPGALPPKYKTFNSGEYEDKGLYVIIDKNDGKAKPAQWDASSSSFVTQDTAVPPINTSDSADTFIAGPGAVPYGVSRQAAQMQSAKRYVPGSEIAGVAHPDDLGPQIAKSIGRQAFPTGAGMLAFLPAANTIGPLAAEAALPLGPVASTLAYGTGWLLGGAGASLLASTGTQYAQDAAINAIFGDQSMQDEINRTARPYIDPAVGTAMSVAAFRPSPSLLARGAMGEVAALKAMAQGGAMNTALGEANKLVSGDFEGMLNVGDIASEFAKGAVLYNTPTRLGHALNAPGEAVAPRMNDWRQQLAFNRAGMNDPAKAYRVGSGTIEQLNNVDNAGMSIADIVASAQQRGQSTPAVAPEAPRMSANSSLVPMPPPNVGSPAIQPGARAGESEGWTGDNNASPAYRDYVAGRSGGNGVLPPGFPVAGRSGRANVVMGENGPAFVEQQGPPVASLNVETALPGEPTTQNLPLQGQLSAHYNLMGESGGKKGIIPFTVQFIRSFGLEAGPIDNEGVGYWRDSDTGVVERNPVTQFNITLPTAARVGKETVPSIDKSGNVEPKLKEKLDAIAAAVATVGGQKGTSWFIPINGEKNPEAYNAGVQISSPNFPRLDVYGIKAISEELSRLIKEDKGITGNVDIGVMHAPNGLHFVDFNGDFNAGYLYGMVAKAYDATIGKHYNVDADVHLFNFASSYFEAGGGMMPEGSRLTPKPDSANVGPYGQGYAERLGELSGRQRTSLNHAIADANATRRALAGNADPGFAGLRYDANGIPFNPDLSSVNATNLRTDEAGRVASPARPALRREVNVPSYGELGSAELQGRQVMESDRLPPQTTYAQDEQTRTQTTPASTGGMERPATSTVERERDARLARRAAQDITREPIVSKKTGWDRDMAFESGIIRELQLRYGQSSDSAIVKGGEAATISLPRDPFEATSERAGNVLSRIGSKTGEKLSFRTVLDSNGSMNKPNEQRSHNGMKIQVVNENGDIIAQSDFTISVRGGQVHLTGGHLDTSEAYRKNHLGFALKAEALSRVSKAIARSTVDKYFSSSMEDVSMGQASSKANLRAMEPGVDKANMNKGYGNWVTDTVQNLIDGINLTESIHDQEMQLADYPEKVAGEYRKELEQKGGMTTEQIDAAVVDKMYELEQLGIDSVEKYSRNRSTGISGRLRVNANYSVPEGQPKTTGLGSETPVDAKNRDLEARMKRAGEMVTKIESLRGTGRFEMMGGEKAIKSYKDSIDGMMKEYAENNGVDLSAHAKEVSANLDAETARQRGETVPDVKPGLEKPVQPSAEAPPMSKDVQQSRADNRQEMLDSFESDSMMLDDAGRRLAGVVINGTDIRGALTEIAKGKDMHAKLAKLLLKFAHSGYLDKTVSAYKGGQYGEKAGGVYIASGPESISGDAAKGDYHTTQGAVNINYHSLMNPEGAERSGRSTVMHEIVHGVISDAVNRALYGRVATMNEAGRDVMGTNGKNYLDRLRAYVKSSESLQNVGVSRIIQAYLKYYSTLPQHVRDAYEAGKGGENLGGTGHTELIAKGAQYGAVNVHEFMSEALSNKDFAQTLEQIKMGKTNLFTVFKNAVAKLLGLNATSDATLLSEVIDAGLQTASTPLSEINKPGRLYEKTLTNVKAERFAAENQAAGGFQRTALANKDTAEFDVAMQRNAAQSEKPGAADIQADLEKASNALKSETDPNMRRRLGDEVLRLETELMASHQEAMARIESQHTPEQMQELNDMAQKRGIEHPTPDQLNQLARIREQQMAEMPTKSEVDAVRRKANADDRFAETQRLKREGYISADEAMFADELAAENKSAESNLGPVEPASDSADSIKAAEEANRLREQNVSPHEPTIPNAKGETKAQMKQRLADEKRARDNAEAEHNGWSVNDVMHPSTKGLSKSEQRSLLDDVRSGKFLKREVLDSKRRVQAISEIVRRGDMTPAEAAKWGARTTMDLVTLKMIASNQAEILTMADRTGSKVALEVYRMLNGGVPGRTEDPAVGQAYHSAVSTRSTQFKNKKFDALRPFESELKDMDRGQQKAFLEEIGRLVAAGTRDAEGNWIPSTPSDPKMAKVVSDFRSLYREMHAYQVYAGIEVGNWGGTYLPRMLNNDYVINNRESFISAATEAYKTTGMDAFNAEKSAMHWYDAVLRGDSGFTYGSDFIFDGATLNGEPKHTRDRVFGPEGEALLEQFYNRNILDATDAYINRAVRNAEVSRRFGNDFGRYRELQNRFIEEGNSQKLRQMNDLVASQLGATSSGNASDSAILHFMQSYSAIHFLPRATFSSLSEPAILAVRTGNVLDAFHAYKDSADQFLRQIVHAGPDYHAKLAEDLGVVLGHLADSATASSIESRYFSEHSRRGGSWLTNQFFRRTGLSQWTEATRVASIKMGETFINRLANDVLDMNNTQMSSHKFLRELGVQDVRGFSEFVRDLNSTKSKRDDVRRQAIMSSNGKHAEAYRQALVRFAEQTIMNPNAGTRPRWANHPLGSVIFNLQSYLYAFHENVTKRVVRLAGSAVDPRSNMTMQDRMRMAAPIGILAASSVIQYALGELRKEIFNDPARAFNPEDSEPTKWGRAVSRANIIGRYDFVMNALLGLKYDKEPATVMAGPVLGAFSEAFKAIADTMSVNNRPTTNTAERKAARLGYDLVAQPAMNAAFSAVPGGWIGGAVGAAGIQASSHPGVREAAVENMAGPPIAPRNRKPNSSFWDDVMPE